MSDYNKEEIKRLEEKWRNEWEKCHIYKVHQLTESGGKPKYYVLDMFPYPSGAGLHVGHPLGYIASDIVARFKRLKGFNVLHPMGFDAFGLPAEQYAIQTGQHPAITTANNIETYKRQLKQIGFSYDWSREVQTCHPNYYKWTQWIFMQLFNSWYNNQSILEGLQSTANGRAENISTLLAELEKNGNKNIEAASDENTPVITSDQWRKFNEKEREEFLQQYRIAYQSETMVNWCQALGTVLSNDEVKEGVSERGGYPVERIKMMQWSMRITAYAERLLNGLDTIDWPDPVKEMQRNWIGKSTGCELDFAVVGHAEKIRVFTTRIDTIYGVTFMVLAPEHELVKKITTADQRNGIEEYVEVAKNRSERERMSEVKRISGAFTGAYVVNPFNNEKIQVWIADYVLAGYGTGAVMAVPSSDTRDYAFAKYFNLPVVDVLEGPYSDITKDNFDPKSGKMIHSDFLNGLPWNEAVEKALEKVEALEIGERKINYRMRDAIFGRQRYWGEPFPIYYQDGLPKLVAEQDLPVTLPEIDEYKPTASGEPPLARAKDWKYSLSPNPSPKESYPFELTTMPGWAGSSWYWFRYMASPEERKENVFAPKSALQYWKEVDLYIGGSEHATGHLLYSRFWCKALKDLGYVESEEPFKKLINQGHIQGVSQKIFFTGNNSTEAISASNTFMYDGELISIKDAKIAFYTYDKVIEYQKKNPAWVEKNLRDIHVDIQYVTSETLDIDQFLKWRPEFIGSIFFCKGGYYLNGKFTAINSHLTESTFLTKPEVEKMSKSKYNVVNPDDIIESYGADTLRMYEMFLGPLEQSKPWNTHGIDGVYKFLRRFWNLFHNEKGNVNVSDAEPSQGELKVLHKTIKKIEQDVDTFSFNTSVSELMICVNELTSLKSNKRAILEPLVISLSPFAPHIAEELWEKLGHGDSIFRASFPEYKEEYLKENSFEYPISINGRVRAKMEFALDMPKEDIEKLVMTSEIIQKWTEGKAPKKVIIVQGKIVNVVL